MRKKSDACLLTPFCYSKNSQQPIEVRKGTDAKFLFDCPCGHEMSQSPNQIISQGSWCKYCSNCKDMCYAVDCKMCFGPIGRPDMAPFMFTKKIFAGEPINVFNYGIWVT